MRVRSGSAILIAMGLVRRTVGPQFEVASVKPSSAPVGSPGSYVFSQSRMTWENASIESLISRAWNVRGDQIFGLVGWARSSTFTVNARAAGKATDADMWLMVQSLLQDRFRLRSHFEKRQMEIFVLKRSGNMKLQPSAPQPCVPKGTPMGPPRPNRVWPCGSIVMSMSPGGGGHLRGGQVSAADLVMRLSGVLHHSIEDRSEKSGLFDIDLTFDIDMDQPGSPDLRGQPSGGPGSPAPPGPPAFHYIPPGLNKSLSRQLGLTLQSSKGPVQVLVIDHVERPTAN